MPSAKPVGSRKMQNGVLVSHTTANNKLFPDLFKYCLYDIHIQSYDEIKSNSLVLCILVCLPFLKMLFCDIQRVFPYHITCTLTSFTHSLTHSWLHHPLSDVALLK